MTATPAAAFSRPPGRLGASRRDGRDHHGEEGRLLGTCGLRTELGRVSTVKAWDGQGLGAASPPGRIPATPAVRRTRSGIRDGPCVFPVTTLAG
jgi:hypothetical protein